MFKNSETKEGKSIAAFFKDVSIKALEGLFSIEKNSTQGYSFLSEEHLGCFVGGMYALAANSIEGLDPKKKEAFFAAAKRYTEGCYMVYHKSPTGLAPYIFDIKNSDGNMAALNGDTLLRPEAIESCFYMWRYTHEQKYRDWCWDMIKAIIKHQKRKFGFTGLHHALNVKSDDDHQPSWWFAETTKYAYLLFSDDDLIPLDKYVFNTEAHPLPLYIK